MDGISWIPFNYHMFVVGIHEFNNPLTFSARQFASWLAHIPYYIIPIIFIRN